MSINSTDVSAIFQLDPDELKCCSACSVFSGEKLTRPDTDSMTISIVSMGTVECADALCRTTKDKVGILNFANGYNCGGSFGTGKKGSQEEDIFRKTTLPVSLWPHRRPDQEADCSEVAIIMKRMQRGVALYPFEHKTVLVSPHTRILNSSAKPMVVVSVAAQDLRKKREKFNHDLMFAKICKALDAFRYHECGTIVLGAFGCGAFKHNSWTIAEMFKKALDKRPFANVFFAIIKSRKNIKAFSEVFDVPITRQLSSNTTMVSPNCIYFYHHNSRFPWCQFSQFYRAKFYGNDGEEYEFAEQWMMTKKARLFGASETAEEMMITADPVKIKRLGRKKVPKFNPIIWDEKKYDIVVQGNLRKFGQNPKLKAVLLSTGNKTLVEAARKDKIWGIGISVEDAKNGKPWQGQNLLGKALMDVREMLRASDEAICHEKNCD